jgi:hypothetical protein
MDSNGLATPRLPLDGAQPGRAEPSATALNLRQKLAQVRREVGYIQKRGKNELHNYSYAMAADIAGAIGDRLALLNVVLGRRNLCVKRSEQHHGESLVEVTLDYTFIDADSDEVLTVSSYGEGRDGGDKAPYKALTGALKYALIQTFLIATGDDPEEERPDDQAMPRKGEGHERLSSAEVQTLGELIEQTGTDLAKVLEFYEVSKLEEMTEENYRKALRLLRLKTSKGAGKNGAGGPGQPSNAKL